MTGVFLPDYEPEAARPPDEPASAALTQAWASAVVAGLNPDSPKGKAFTADCPGCREKRASFLAADGGAYSGVVGILCHGDCSNDRIIEQWNRLERLRTARQPEPAHWLDGAPMDPSATTVESLPALPGFPFVPDGGGSVVIVGPTGGGRSSLAQACAYDAARAGLRVAYLGSEVTEREFNARARALADGRGDAVDDELRAQLARVRFLDLASVLEAAWTEPETWPVDAASRFDVLIIDPLSAVASALDLDFDKRNAEFVRFHEVLVQPLVTAAVAVVMLDDVGHAVDARNRAKGVSAKADRADLAFSCKTQASPVGLVITATKVRSVRAPFRRGDTWVFLRNDQMLRPHGTAAIEDEAPFRPTVVMERVSCALEEEPGLTGKAIRSAVKGSTDAKRLAVETLVSEGYVRCQKKGAQAGAPLRGPAVPEGRRRRGGRGGLGPAPSTGPADPQPARNRPAGPVGRTGPTGPLPLQGGAPVGGAGPPGPATVRSAI